MANWCWNTVEFRGAPDRLERLRKEFTLLAGRCYTEQKGQLPEFVNSEDGYFFDLSCCERIYDYMTKWVPNLDVLLQIARHHQLDFTQNYDEPGNCVYGRFTYNNGELTGKGLDFADFSFFQYDEESESYVFEGQRYGDSQDIREILLNRKKEVRII